MLGVGVVVLVVGAFLAGLFIARINTHAVRAAYAIETYVLWVALPAIIILEIPPLELGIETLIAPSVAWVGAGAGLAYATWLLKRWDVPRATRGAFILVVSLGNTAFLGFPFVQALRGSEQMGTAVLFDQLGSFLCLATVGSAVVATFGSGNSPTIRSIAYRILRFPPFVAVILAIGLRWSGTSLPVPELWYAVSAPMGAAAMAAVGLRFPITGLPRQPSILASALVWKLALWPAAVCIAIRAAGWDPVIGLQAAMPPMAMAGVLAAHNDLDAEFASSAVGIGLAVSMVTVPLWNLLLPVS